MKDYMLMPVKILEIKTIKEDNEEFAIIDCIDSFYNNIDLGGDRVLPGFFTKDLQERGNERPALVMHKSWEIPYGLNVHFDSPEGLRSIVKMPLSDRRVREELLPQLKVGSIKGKSIGYETITSKYNEIDRCRDLIEGKLYETSFVTFPMNPKCVVLSIRKSLDSISKNEYKSQGGYSKKQILEIANMLELEDKIVPAFKDYSLMDEKIAWDKEKAITQIKEHTDSEDEPSKSYKDGFMYFDSENEDKFTAYKLPYVYWDGEFKAVPRGLYAITGVLSGARGGADIPEEDKEKIKSQLNKYYKKLGKDEPFKSDGKCFIDLDTLKSFEKRDFEKIFDEEVILSNNAKKYLIDHLTFQGDGEGDNKSVEFLNALNEIKNTLGGKKDE